MPIEDFTDDELEHEIKRKRVAKADKYKAIVAAKPKIIFNGSSELDELRKHCSKYIDLIANGKRRSRFPEAIADAAVKVFFGDDVFDWVVERLILDVDMCGEPGLF